MPTPIAAKPSIARLVVERGGPYEKGICFPLQQSKIILGRATNSFNPDISFDSLLISRKHCCIEQASGIWSACELGSKHGTMLNSKPLQQCVPSPLNHGDKLGLASSVVLLHFLLSEEFERTLGFDNTLSLQTVTTPKPDLPVTIDIAQKSLLVNNLAISVSVKEWRLLELLYKHRNALVSYETIRVIVWAERCPLEGIPDVGFDEMNVLIYRLRRKLGDYSSILKTRRGQGCILEIK